MYVDICKVNGSFKLVIYILIREALRSEDCRAESLSMDNESYHKGNH